MDILIVMMGLVVCFVFSISVTGILQTYALKHSLIDVPNERSSHSLPTPRGGGLSIVIPVLLSIAVLFFTAQLETNITLALGAGCFFVASVGWIDDHRHIPANWRALLYGITAVSAVYFLAVSDSYRSVYQNIPFAIVSSVLIVIWIVWMTNLYNFMDGTDALAAIQTICAGISIGVIFWLEGQYGLATVCFVISASSCGFLFWNWPPAKIFMGDVGSCSLGFCFGVLAVIGEIQGSVPFAVFFILLSIFICDTTFTLLMRIFANEKWYQAHKSHAYQRLVQLGMSHKKLAIIVLFVNVLILWPLAWAACQKQDMALYIACFTGVLMATSWGMIQIKYHNSMISER
ncbi:MAG: glycosyltransferase family 4 protein [Gammaproteobacteria bacterium]